ncbi:sulfotransferase domain-containing protein [Shimia ponticola]|uniref:sulfotransferase domain-containing protein n=1 Tax=Shimia ponticola TaxID=2582893 RepID=UPI0011BE9DF4|nr:sulfotransferase domain-containing protein [Shimia ponticola]
MSHSFPDFFIIGAPKCGTTTLFDWLKQHPGTHLVVKEPSFFSQDIFPTDTFFGLTRDLETYLDKVCPEAAQGRMTGEATPKYLYSDAALAALAARKDEIRIVVCLRNPIDLCVSLFGQFVKQGDETRSDFATAWAQPDPEDVRGNYQFWGQFGARLEKVFELFSRDQVLVLILEEELKSDPEAAYHRLVSHLGLSEDFVPPLSRSNEAIGMRSVRVNALLNRLRRWLRRNGMPVANTGILKTFRKANQARPTRQTIDPALRHEMAAFFRADVARTAALLHRDSLPWPDFFPQARQETPERPDQ